MAWTVRRATPALRGSRARRARAAAVAAVVLTLLAPLGPSATADNGTPVFPSQQDVDASRGAAAAKADQVGQIEAQLAAASVRTERLATDVARAVEAYNGARVRLDRAVQAAVEAQQQRRPGAGRGRDGAGRARPLRGGGLPVRRRPRRSVDLPGRGRPARPDQPRVGAAVHRQQPAQRPGELPVRDGVRHRARPAAAATVEKRQQAARQVERAKAAAEAGSRPSSGSSPRSRPSARRWSGRSRRPGTPRSGWSAPGRPASSRPASRRRGSRPQRRAAEEARKAEAARAAAAARAAEDARRAQAEVARRADEQRAADRRAAEEKQAAEDKRAADERAAATTPATATAAATAAAAAAAAVAAVAARRLRPAPEPPGSSSGTASGAEAAIDYARAQIGKPYQWAADGPSTFDCSGLTMRAWQQAGVYLPHYSVAQYQQGQKVGLGDLRRGDLVFFASGSDYRSIYHVGLYIGDGQMIEAPYTGENVRISSIWREQPLRRGPAVSPARTASGTAGRSAAGCSCWPSATSSCTTAARSSPTWATWATPRPGGPTGSTCSRRTSSPARPAAPCAARAPAAAPGRCSGSRTVMYTQGHGIHLAANSINNALPGSPEPALPVGRARRALPLVHRLLPGRRGARPGAGRPAAARRAGRAPAGAGRRLHELHQLGRGADRRCWASPRRWSSRSGACSPGTAWAGCCSRRTASPACCSWCSACGRAASRSSPSSAGSDHLPSGAFGHRFDRKTCGTRH